MKVREVARRVAARAAAKDARPYEIAAARAVCVALGVKLGVNFFDYLK